MEFLNWMSLKVDRLPRAVGKQPSNPRLSVKKRDVNIVMMMILMERASDRTDPNPVNPGASDWSCCMPCWMSRMAWSARGLLIRLTTSGFIIWRQQIVMLFINILIVVMYNWSGYSSTWYYDWGEVFEDLVLRLRYVFENLDTTTKVGT